MLRELSKVFPKVRYEPIEQEWYKVPEKPDLIFLPAWHPNYLPLMGALPKTRFCMVWTSPPFQSEFAPVEFEYLKKILWLLDQGRIHAVWFGSREWVDVSTGGRKVFYAPYPVTMPRLVERERESPPKNVSLFGPLSPRKNVFNQMLGAKWAGATVHTTDNGMMALFSNFGGKAIHHGWLPEPSYDRLFDLIDLGMQLSVPGVESFSYVAWDHIARGIPCLTNMEWSPPTCQIWNPFDPSEISSTILHGRFAPPTAYRQHAERYAERANRNCREMLELQLGISL